MVDEDDLKWVVNEKILRYYKNSSIDIFVLKTLGYKYNQSSEMQNDALVHREGLKGYNNISGVHNLYRIGLPASYPAIIKIFTCAQINASPRGDS